MAESIMALDSQNRSDNMAYLDICENGSVALGRDEAGKLYIRKEGGWGLYDFNSSYAGYYPACCFTALGAGGGLFYAAGIDSSGFPHLFSSLSGGVWEEHGLAARTPFGSQTQARGRIVSILYAESARQVLLVTDAGQVVTLPDCPKCIQIRDIPGCPASARLQEDMLEINLADGTSTKIYLRIFLQYRVSWSYASELVQSGGKIIDLRTPEEFASGTLDGSVNVPFGLLADWLRGQKKDSVLLFLCRMGTLADEAADFARSDGWEKAYSMGGLDVFGHVE
ncbi:MAG: rhodanese-like domain-containing protein [Lachnospiraceae bacterium]|nr:rhodanese-like domain-containing protein [Lachnospiraceae bacterium]